MLVFLLNMLNFGCMFAVEDLHSSKILVWYLRCCGDSLVVVHVVARRSLMVVLSNLLIGNRGVLALEVSLSDHINFLRGCVGVETGIYFCSYGVRALGVVVVS